MIQNAKDVSNEFGRCRIKIEIFSDRLVFSHNGDPFEMDHLQSLVDQYSSKTEENTDDVETTGKYGTGFIATYILSRKVRIKGIIEMKDSEDAMGMVDEKDEPQKEARAVEENEYQRFEIFLDREYKQRDTELVRKLMMTEHVLMADLMRGQAQPKWRRKEDDLDTQFIYEQLDEAAQAMIQ